MKRILIMVLAVLMLFTGCTELIEDTDVYVATIKSAYMNGTSYTYDEVFSNFFSFPIWTHFTSSDGQEVVEFKGNCTYDNEPVRAKIQFVITYETEESISWEASYLSFNNVNQPLIMLAALMEKAIEEYDEEKTNQIAQKNAGADLSEKELIKITKKNLGVPDKKGITYEMGNKQYNEVWDAYYVGIYFYENGDAVAGANVDIKTGELISNIMGYHK